MSNVCGRCFSLHHVEVRNGTQRSSKGNLARPEQLILAFGCNGKWQRRTESNSYEGQGYRDDLFHVFKTPWFE